MDIYTSNCIPYINNIATFTYDQQANPESIIQSILITESGNNAQRFITYRLRGQNDTAILDAKYEYINGVLNNSTVEQFYNGLTTALQGNGLLIAVMGNSIISKISTDSIATSTGDNYLVQLIGCQNDDLRAQVTLTRCRNVGVGASGCNTCACFIDNSCGNIRVPIITISGQTTFDGEYLANMFIYDL